MTISIAFVPSLTSHDHCLIPMPQLQVPTSRLHRTIWVRPAPTLERSPQTFRVFDGGRFTMNVALAQRAAWVREKSAGKPYSCKFCFDMKSCWSLMSFFGVREISKQLWLIHNFLKVCCFWSILNGSKCTLRAFQRTVKITQKWLPATHFLGRSCDTCSLHCAHRHADRPRQRSPRPRPAPRREARTPPLLSARPHPLACAGRRSARLLPTAPPCSCRPPLYNKVNWL